MAATRRLYRPILIAKSIAQSGEHQGWPGIVHGGIITSLLYEVLENLLYYQGVVTMMKTQSFAPSPLHG